MPRSELCWAGDYIVVSIVSVPSMVPAPVHVRQIVLLSLCISAASTSLGRAARTSSYQASAAHLRLVDPPHEIRAAGPNTWTRVLAQAPWGKRAAPHGAVTAAGNFTVCSGQWLHTRVGAPAPTRRRQAYLSSTQEAAVAAHVL